MVSEKNLFSYRAGSGSCLRTVRTLFHVLGALLLLCAAAVSADVSNCAPPVKGEPTFLTADCIDPVFIRPVIDIEEMRTEPVTHRYVNGHFEGTDARFSFYFPQKQAYRGRFYQPTHPSWMDENAPPEDIEFTLSVGAYLVHTNMNLYTLTGTQNIRPDNSEAGAYRVNAAAAKFSREVAARVYGDHRPFGYLYGGSGGSGQTIAGVENSTGIWDGAVPYIMWTPSALPLNLLSRIWALRVLKGNDRFAAIMDAIDPGGSGDMYAGLNREERTALAEATRMGFPPRGWWNWSTMTTGALISYGLVAVVPAFDPGYVGDFWSKPGYLGTDPSYSTRAARIQHEAKAVSVQPGPPMAVELSSVPTGDLTGFDLILTDGEAAGGVIPINSVKGNTVIVGLGFGSDPAVLDAIESGDTARVDNSWFLAYETYNRHQVPGRDEYGFDQYRGPDGAPLYPQRDILVAHKAGQLANGGRLTGDFNGKMIVVQALMDIDTFPWQADWYRTKVKAAKGEQFDDNYRLWFVDYAQHVPIPGPEAAARTVLHRPVVRQALRDISAWVEKGIAPPASTEYKVVDSQVLVPPTAAQRKGIQPVIQLTANGEARADIAVGDSVSFQAQITVPPGAGKVVAAEWDFLGVGDYPDAAELGEFQTSLRLNATHTYTEPGTYFPVLRGTSQREGDARDPYHRVQNLGRVRVVVR